MCREGGCGCCVVSVTRNDLSTGKDATIAVNSVRDKFLLIVRIRLPYRILLSKIGILAGKSFVDVDFTLQTNRA